MTEDGIYPQPKSEYANVKLGLGPPERQTVSNTNTADFKEIVEKMSSLFSADFSAFMYGRRSRYEFITLDEWAYISPRLEPKHKDPNEPEWMAKYDGNKPKKVPAYLKNLISRLDERPNKGDFS